MVDQVGGDHYSQGSYQHWDWVGDIRLGYLGACATKYIIRHRRKNGRQDLEKALSYVQKMREVGIQKWGGIPCNDIGYDLVASLTNRLVASQDIQNWEHTMCCIISQAVDPDDLIDAESGLERMISDMPRDTEESTMRAAHKAGMLDHPAPYGYDGSE